MQLDFDSLGDGEKQAFVDSVAQLGRQTGDELDSEEGQKGEWADVLSVKKACKKTRKKARIGSY